MAMTEAQKRADKAYKSKLDHIMIRPTKEDGERIRAEAAAAGLSVNAYVLDKLKEEQPPSIVLGAYNQKVYHCRCCGAWIEPTVNIAKEHATLAVKLKFCCNCGSPIKWVAD